jgi:hypothetical protein
MAGLRRCAPRSCAAGARHACGCAASARQAARVAFHDTVRVDRGSHGEYVQKISVGVVKDRRVLCKILLRNTATTYPSRSDSVGFEPGRKNCRKAVFSSGEWLGYGGSGRVWSKNSSVLRCQHRDTRYCRSFRTIIESGDVKTLPLPARSPNLNAFGGRWVKSVKDDCLSKLILLAKRL